MVTRIVIIGGGPAGYEAALVAAGYGPEATEVTVVDRDGIGGACVLWDCVPSKTFIASTGVRTELRRADGLGFDIKIEDAKISLPQINNRVKTLARSQSVDIGGQLSHAAVVARELGIPCVMNTLDGTRTLRDGDRLRVDGGAGTVEILARAGSG